jgi:hypothetical protein
MIFERARRWAFRLIDSRSRIASGQMRLGGEALAIAIICLLGGAGTLRGQALPAEIRTANDIDAGAQATIDTDVKGQVALLVGETPRDARVELIHNSVAPPQPPALSAAFLDAYAASLDTALQAELDKKPSDAVRLNIAVVAAEVAANADNARLGPTIQRCLADPCEAVVLWGIKGAGYILPNELAIPALAQGDQLLPGIKAAVDRFPNDGEIASSAYEALTPAGPPQGNLTADEFQEVFTRVVPALQTLLNSRLAEYTKGIPNNPTAVLKAVRYLSDTQKLSTMQAFLNLISNASQRAIGAGHDDRTALIDVISQTAGALFVVAGARNAADGGAVESQLTTLHDIRSQSTDEQLANATTAAINAVVKQIPQLTVPPTLPAVATTQAASTQAATTQSSATQPTGAGATTAQPGGGP